MASEITQPLGAGTSKGEYNLLCVGIGGTGVIRASMILAWAALREGFKVRTAETHGMSQRGGAVSSYLRFGSSLEGPFMVQGNVDVLLAFEISEALRNLDYVNRHTFILASKNVVIPPSVLTHRKLRIDSNKCIGCGNCLAHCVPSRVFHDKERGLGNDLTLVSGPAREIRNGYSIVLESCTGCTRCIVDNVCPFGAITAFNEWEYPPVVEIEKDLNKASENVIVVDANQIAMEAGNILAANVVMLGTLAGIELLPIQEKTFRETIQKFIPAKALAVNMTAFNEGFKIGKDFVQNKK